ncbi:acetyl-CoA carboxylase, biotin carboxyl carrier protein [Clostridium bornimense]|uniref:acetyl-CoA carboxylase biotin carboxyl carrier protein n=1 Tax=Clostridium bornimense TaxID=1216932 RepID=UPI001C10C535|nr:acetyl-CoA carboxylase biotin carboxyl carrier protein subunit [Clostridium bornimense]MBU5316400.1 acetyl-CoA carboxylase, biotin carboxyl carrier protein [Clostridium bornimense]
MSIDDLNELLSIIGETPFSKIKVKIDDVYLELEKPEYESNSSCNKIQYSDDNNKEDLFKDIEENDNIKVIKAPMVGVFYRSSNQDEEVFVKEGDDIKKGDTIGIIEAMKIMSEVSSEVDGEVVEVCCEDKANVGYGQPLVKIKIK